MRAMVMQYCTVTFAFSAPAHNSAATLGRLQPRCQQGSSRRLTLPHHEEPVAAEGWAVLGGVEALPFVVHPVLLVHLTANDRQ